MKDNQLELSQYKAGLVGIGFDNPLTSEGICQVLGREPELWANRIVSAINGTYGSGINPEAVPELLRALKEVISVSDRKTDIYDRAKAAIEKATIKP